MNGYTKAALIGAAFGVFQTFMQGAGVGAGFSIRDIVAVSVGVGLYALVTVAIYAAYRKFRGY